MPSDGTKMIDAGWPMEIEFTDKYPVYYLEKLLHGEDWEKDLAASRLSNNSANNGLMWGLSSHPGIEGKSVLEILEEAHHAMKGKGKANILVNTMALLGAEKYYSMGPYLDGRFRYDHVKGEKNPPPLPGQPGGPPKEERPTWPPAHWVDGKPPAAAEEAKGEA